MEGRPDLPVVREEAIEDVEGVELRQPQTGAPFPGEADVGHLGGGEHPMVLEQTAQVTIPFGDPTEHRQQSMLSVAPAPTADRRCAMPLLMLSLILMVSPMALECSW